MSLVIIFPRVVRIQILTTILRISYRYFAFTNQYTATNDIQFFYTRTGTIIFTHRRIFQFSGWSTATNSTVLQLFTSRTLLRSTTISLYIQLDWVSSIKNTTQSIKSSVNQSHDAVLNTSSSLAVGLRQGNQTRSHIRRLRVALEQGGGAHSSSISHASTPLPTSGEIIHIGLQF